MEPKLETFIDKSTWGPGPWQQEPDRIEWRSHGLPCLIVRAGSHGALCGYVGVPEGHPYHGAEGFSGEPTELDVHGGITYGAPCQAGGKICHVPQPGESDHVWWLGFDCSHYMDHQPGRAAYWRERGMGRDLGYEGGIYWTVDDVRAEVERLAEQIAAAGAAS